MAPREDITFDDEHVKIQDEDRSIYEIKNIPKIDPNWKYDFAWPMVVFFIILHTFAPFGLYFALFDSKWLTVVFSILYFQASHLGVTAGAHRLFSHKAFKAKLPTRIFLMLMNTISFQGPIIKWVRDHRQHHKFSDTEADPHNSRRGFMYSHVGWIYNRKSPYIRKMGQVIDISDCYKDPVQVFQLKNYWFLMPILTFLLPTTLPVYLWDERWLVSLSMTMLRHAYNIHVTAFINSFAHFYGNKPYDRNMKPTESKLLSFFASGECFHNYHHAFPFDYKTSEYPNYFISITTCFVETMSRIGQIYDRRMATKNMIERRAERTGDGTRVKIQ